MVTTNEGLADDIDCIIQKIQTGELLNVQHVAGMLNKSESTIRRWLGEGKLKGIKLGGRYLVEKESIRLIFTDDY